MEDKEIIEQLKNGNDECIKYLYLHLGPVKNWVMNNSGEEHDALDLFQEALIVFYRNLKSGKYEYKSKISTYLFEICKRQWYTQLNRRQKHEPLRPDIIQKDIRIEGFTVEINNVDSKLKSYLENALTKLGEPCKKLLQAAVFQKTRMQQLATDFGYADAHSARQQKLRCLKRLRGFVSYEVVMQLN